MAKTPKKSSKSGKNNIICTARDLKKGERRGSMIECAQKKQIRYYGVKKADKVALDIMYGKKLKEPKLTYFDARAKALGIKYRADKVKQFIENAKRKDDKDKLKKYQSELEELRKKYAKVIKIVNKLKP